MKTLQLNAHDQHPILAYTWEHHSPKGWVHICHGMAEHALRYAALAEQLVEAGYSVVAHNHRGHGPANDQQLGHYADKQGWQSVLTDVDTVRTQCTDAHIPYFLFGHSMGSFIAQAYLATQPKPISGLILSGSKLESGLIATAGSWVAKLERLRLGIRGNSRLIDFLSFGSFNRAFKPTRTDYDWLSRDPAEVDKYIADPYCGFSCTTQLWIDLLKGITQLYKKSTLNSIQTDLPVYMFGGDQDPVGEQGKALPKLYEAYIAAGQQNVTIKLYPEGRHEMLNETNRDEVISDLLIWLKQYHLKDKQVS